jgi:hypothetical protein
MKQNSYVTPGILNSCNHQENYTRNYLIIIMILASYYIDYSKILSVVIRKAKIIEHDKLILNSHNKVKSTRGIVNKNSG